MFFRPWLYPACVNHRRGANCIKLGFLAIESFDFNEVQTTLLVNPSSPSNKQTKSRNQLLFSYWWRFQSNLLLFRTSLSMLWGTYSLHFGLSKKAERDWIVCLMMVGTVANNLVMLELKRCHAKSPRIKRVKHQLIVKVTIKQFYIARVVVSYDKTLFIF